MTETEGTGHGLTRACVESLAIDLSESPAVPVSERPAFEDVYREYFDFVWRNARALGTRDAAVDDVVQDVFLVVHRRLSEFEGRSTLRTWISGIVLNVVRRHRRTTQRRSPHEDSKEAPLDPETLAGRGESPYDAAVHAEGTELLQRILDELDEDKREVLVLAELEELSVPEIAGALGIKLNTAYSRLRLARQAFEQSLVRHRARERRRQP